MVRPLTRWIAINLNRRVANAEPFREHRPSGAQQRVVVVITRTRHMRGQRDEPAGDSPDMEVVDVRHMWQLEQCSTHLINVDVPRSPLHKDSDGLANERPR